MKLTRDASQLSLSSLRRIEKACDQFESDFQPGLGIGSYLEGFSGLERRALLEELVAIDFELHQELGVQTIGERYAGIADLDERQVAEKCFNQHVAEQPINRDGRNLSTIAGHADESRAERSKAPQRIGTYTIIRRIGRGGMGEVYLAEQKQPVQRRVALKIISISAPSKDMLARFDAERQALAMMDHNNIARVFDGGMTEEGLPFFAMEFVQGDQITGFCESQSLKLQDRLKLFIQTCRAVQHAHQKGVMHRDLKPGNVLVTRQDGEPVVKVIDFGLVKAVQPSTRLGDQTIHTQHGQIVGTLAYMSPEQAASNVNEVDARSDVYSLGVILYELLTQTTPISKHRIENAIFDEILRAIREEDVTRPSLRLREHSRRDPQKSRGPLASRLKFQQQLEDELDWIALRALDKAPAQRYATAAALADDVERFLAGDPIIARPPSAIYQLKKAFDRYTKWFVIAAFLLTVLVLALLGTGTMWIRATLAEGDALQKSKLASVEADRARAAEALQRELADEMQVQRDTSDRARKLAVQREARSKFLLAVARWNVGQISEARRLLWQIPAAERHVEWRLLERLLDDSRSTNYDLGSAAIDLVMGNEGQTILSRSPTGKVRAWSFRTLEAIPTSIPEKALALGPNGRTYLRGEGKRDLLLCDLTTHRVLRSLECEEDFGGFEKYVIGEKWIVGVSGADALHCWDRATGLLAWNHRVPIESHQQDYSRDQQVALSPDENFIAVSSGDKVRIFATSNWKQLKQLDGSQYGSSILRFSPDGRFLVHSHIRYMSRRLVAIDLRNLNQTWNREVPFLSEAAITFHPAGHRIAVSGLDNLIYELGIEAGDVQHTYRGHESPVTAIRYSQDGCWLASASENGVLKLWQSRKTDVGVPTITGRGSSTSALGYSDNDRWLVHLSHHNADIWDTRTRKHIRRIRLDWLGTGDSLWSSCLSELSNQLAILDSQGIVSVWDATTGKQLVAFKGPGQTATAICFVGDRLLVADDQGAVRVWDNRFEHPFTLRTFTKSEMGDAQLLRASNPYLSANADSGLAYLTNSHGQTFVWDLETRQPQRFFAPKTNELITACDLSPDGKQMLLADYSGGLSIVDSQHGTIVQKFTTNGEEIVQARFNSDGSRILAINRSQQMTLWDVKSSALLLELPIPKDTRCLDWTAKQDQIAFGGRELIFRVMPIPLEAQSRLLTGSKDRILDWSFADEGRRVIARTQNQTFAWETSSGQSVEPSAVDWTRTQHRFGSWKVVLAGSNLLVVPTADAKLLAPRILREEKRRLLRREAVESSIRQQWFAYAFFLQQQKAMGGLWLTSEENKLNDVLQRLSKEERSLLPYPP